MFFASPKTGFHAVTLICATSVVIGLTCSSVLAQSFNSWGSTKQAGTERFVSDSDESPTNRRRNAKLQRDFLRPASPVLKSTTQPQTTMLEGTDTPPNDASQEPSLEVIPSAESAEAFSDSIEFNSPDQLDSPDQLNSLAALEQLAIESHPTLRAAVARIQTARHEELQAGLGPNPQLGIFIEEAGVDGSAGLWGAYVQRNVIRGNKLELSRTIKNREATVLEREFEKQILRIKTDVRTAFYKLLIAQQKNDFASQLYEAQQKAILKSAQLFEGGETPKTDLLQTQLQSQKTMIIQGKSEVAQINSWRELASIIGRPDLPFRPVNGSLEPIIDTVSFEECLEQIMLNSPELQSAQAEVERVRSTISRQCAETVPDYQTTLNVGRDSSSNHFFAGFRFQVPLQIRNQNQGNIAAAKSRLMVAENDVERIQLDLTKRLATEYQQYESASLQSELYRSKLIPKARETLELLTTGYPEEVGFLQLLTAQQTVIDITFEYLDSLNQLWASRLKIEGFLLDNSLSR